MVQGIVLLNMAHLSPDVLFAEAPQTIKKHIGKLTAQVRAFYDALGHDICQVAQSVLATAGNPNARAAVAWSCGWDAGIKPEFQWIKEEEPGFFGKLISGPNAFKTRQGPKGWGYSGLKVLNERHQFALQVTTDISAKAFDVTKSYPMRLFEGANCVSRFRVPDRQNGICLREDSDYYRSRGQDDNKWLIEPVSVGSNS